MNRRSFLRTLSKGAAAIAGGVGLAALTNKQKDWTQGYYASLDPAFGIDELVVTKFRPEKYQGEWVWLNTEKAPRWELDNGKYKRVGDSTLTHEKLEEIYLYLKEHGGV